MDFYATLGASCADTQTILALFDAGMTGVRLNLSHTSLEDCSRLLNEHYWPAARKAGVKARLIIDLQGPELRVGRLEQPVPFPEGGCVTLGPGGIPVPDEVLRCAGAGAQISLDDSALLVQVESVENKGLVCRVLRGGTLESRKSLTVLGVQTNAPTLTEDDRNNLRAAQQYGVTDVLQPFVRGQEDVLTLRKTLREYGLEHVRIMAKIENREGLEHLDEIAAHADEICIARGDLGNSMPLWELPPVQAQITRRCRSLGRPFYVVTQLLWSMHERAVPTRAEVSDIYRAVLDGTCALMLTGETAAGKYPVQAMDYLVRTARRAMEDLPNTPK